MASETFFQTYRPWSSPSGPITRLKICWPTWASRAAKGSIQQVHSSFPVDSPGQAQPRSGPQRFMPCGDKGGTGTWAHTCDASVMGTPATRVSYGSQCPSSIATSNWKHLLSRQHASASTRLASPFQPSFLHLPLPPLESSFYSHFSTDTAPSSWTPVTPLLPIQWESSSGNVQSLFSFIYHSTHIYCMAGYV